MTSPTPHPSDSAAQRDAEDVILAAIAEQIGVELSRTSIPTGNGGRVEIDGASEDHSALVEVYARQGALAGAQPKKLATDALKLTWIGKEVQAKRLILAVADERVESYLRRPSAWLTQALIDLGVEVIRVEVGATISENLQRAQRSQYR